MRNALCLSLRYVRCLPSTVTGPIFAKGPFSLPARRTIKLSNAAFQQRVSKLSGTIEFLELCGFQKMDEALVMPRDKFSMDVLNAAGLELNNALSNPFFGVL